MNRSTKTVLLLIGIVAGLIGLSLVTPSFSRIASQNYVLMQRSHALRIRAALQSYAEDYDGHYPDRLEALPGLEDYSIKRQYLDEQYLCIDLLDGKPPQRWIYHSGLSESSPATEWVLISPPLVNNKVSYFERGARERNGGLQFPPEKPVRIIIYHRGGWDQSAPIREDQFQELVKSGKLVLPSPTNPAGKG